MLEVPWNEYSYYRLNSEYMTTSKPLCWYLKNLVDCELSNKISFFIYSCSRYYLHKSSTLSSHFHDHIRLLPRMPYQNLLRIIKTEIRQCTTQEYIPGETDAKALEQIQELLSARPRKQRQLLKDVYALLIWNITPGADVTTCKIHEKLDGQALTDEDIDILSRIQRQILRLPTSWDRKRSKWTYVTLIRDMEIERLQRRRASSLGKAAASSTTLTKASTHSSETLRQMPDEIQKRCDEISSQLKASVESGALGAIQVERIRASLNGIYLIEARNELAISSLKERVASQQEALDSLYATVLRLQRNSTGGKVKCCAENGSKDLKSGRSRRATTGERGGDMGFVFFDERK